MDGPVDPQNTPEATTRPERPAGTLPLVLGVLTTLALLAAPHGLFVDETADGTTTQLRFWWDQVAWDADHAAVPGASAVLGLLAAATLTVGAVLVFAGLRQGRRGLVLGGTATVLAGALPTVVYAALWTSRVLVSLVHAVAGYDAPPALLRLDAFTDDAYTAVWTVGPVVVLGLALATVRATTGALAAVPVGEFDLRPQARRHLRAAWLAVVALALLFALPWSIQTLPDNATTFPDGAVDNDAFWFGAYDALRIHEGTTAVAEATNAGAAVQYGELLQLLGWALAATALVATASLLAVHGTLRGADGDRNLGNLWQGSVYGGILASAGLFVVTALGALWLHRPNADIPDEATWLPLAAVLPAVLALLSQVGAARTLASESGTLLADDFPEPIVYD